MQPGAGVLNFLDHVQDMHASLSTSNRRSSSQAVVDPLSGQGQLNALRDHLRTCMRGFEARVAAVAASADVTSSHLLAVIRDGEGLEDIVECSKSAFPSALHARGLRVATTTLARRAARATSSPSWHARHAFAPATSLPGFGGRGTEPGQGMACLDIALELVKRALTERVLEYGTGASKALVNPLQCRGSVADVITGYSQSGRPERALEAQVLLQRCLRGGKGDSSRYPPEVLPLASFLASVPARQQGAVHGCAFKGASLLYVDFNPTQTLLSDR
jgi:hypothetical protein